MKLSVAWLGDYVTLPPDRTIAQIVHDLTMTSVEVEGAEDLAVSLQRVVVARVSAVEAVAGSATLQVARCDTGRGSLTSVCGASNLRPGMLVALALPGASLLGAGGRRDVGPAIVSGVASEAVIAGATELGLEPLFPDAGDRAVMDLSVLPCAPGDPLAAAIGWQDTVLEIDNKSLTNRPDLWCHYGIARELAAIYRQPLRPLPRLDRSLPSAALVGAIEGLACHRFTATRIQNARADPSPFWLRSRLARLGQRPINLYVDLTNYVMLAVGQPCHAYDASRVTLPLGTRFFRPGERLQLLDDSEREPDGTVLAVVDADGAVAVAGVLGGKPSAVSGDTREILLEAASFDALSVRRASLRLGLRTEASSRFEKGIDTQRVDDGLALFLSLLHEIQPEAAVTAFDDRLNRPTPSAEIALDPRFLHERLGTPLPPGEIAARLTSIGFRVVDRSGALLVTAPTWRSTGDVSMAQDLVEEVARLYGYDNFEFVAPRVTLQRAAGPGRARLERRVKEVLAFAGGLQEVVTYPWSGGQFLEAAGIDPGGTLRLAVAPGPDQTALRPSLLPNLLECVARNLPYAASFRIFESGRVFLPRNSAPVEPQVERLPLQPRRLAAALVGADPEALFFEAKGLVQRLFRQAHLGSVRFSPRATEPWAESGARLALIVGDRSAGAIGVLTKRAARLAGIKRAKVILFELDLEHVEALPSRDNAYVPLPAQPEVEFDLSLIFPDTAAWADVVRIAGGADPLVRDVQFVDQYRGQGIAAGRKSLTLRLRLGAPDRTLRSEEVGRVAALAAARLEEAFGAEVRSAPQTSSS
jgi:phenylalanyl-tRNA synthetase beta chain